MLRLRAHRAWLIIPLALLIFALPSWWMRSWLPRSGNLPTPSAIPTVAPLDLTFSQALQLAATDPLSASPLLRDVAFSENSEAEAARTVWQAIQAARLANDPGYTLTASGRALAAIGEWDLARQAFVKAVELDPDYAEAWAYLGEAQQHNGEDGLPALQRAQELDPNSISVRLFLALYWQRQGDFDKADQNFEIAAAQSPNDAMIEILWGQISVLAGSDALPHFQRALELADDPQVWRTLAAYSVETELYVAQIGLPSAQRLMFAAPDDVAAVTLYARACALLDLKESARLSFKRAIQMDANYAPAHLYYGIFLLANGEVGEAHAQLNEVIALVPASREAELAGYWLEQISH